MRDIEAGRS